MCRKFEIGFFCMGHGLAENLRREFMENFEKLPEIKQYFRILDALPLEKLIRCYRDSRPISEKLPELRSYYYTII